MKEIKASLIIPSHNRIDSLLRSLLALNNQTADPDQYEVIVVADGCNDNTCETLEKFNSDFSLTVFELDGSGAAVARNYGASNAKGRILIFMDDDVVPCKGMVEQHIKSHDEEKHRVVIGSYLPVIRERTNFFRTNIRTWWNDQFNNMSKKSHRFSYKDFLTGNISLTKSDFKLLDGFDESFRYIEGFKGACSCEDWELGVRAIKQGLNFYYCDLAHADHHEHETTDFKKFIARAAQEGRGEYLIAERHPSVIEHLQIANFKTDSFFEDLPLRLAIHQSILLDGLVAVTSWTLPIFEFFRFRRSWRNVCGLSRQYWYWKGVTEKLKSKKAIETFVQKCISEKNSDIDWLELDLANNIDNLMTEVNKARPEALAIVYGELQIINIPSSDGTEKLRGDHLKNLLYDNLLHTSYTWSLPFKIVDQ